MRGTIRTDEACAIDGKANGQPLDGNVMHHLVVGALEESRVNRSKRLIPLRCKACCKCHSVLFGYADIETAVWKFFGKNIDAGSIWHCRCNTDNLVIGFGKLAQRIAKNLGVRGCVGHRFFLRASDNVKTGHPMIFVG